MSEMENSTIRVGASEVYVEPSDVRVDMRVWFTPGAGRQVGIRLRGVVPKECFRFEWTQDANLDRHAFAHPMLVATPKRSTVDRHLTVELVDHGDPVDGSYALQILARDAKAAKHELTDAKLARLVLKHAITRDDDGEWTCWLCRRNSNGRRADHTKRCRVHVLRQIAKGKP